VAPSDREITRLLATAKSGDRNAESQLINLVYPDLRAMAGHFMRKERPDHTLQPTALCHEAYIRVEMRYFGGRTEVEAAEVLGVSVRAIERDWNAARAWLQAQFPREPA